MNNLHEKDDAKGNIPTNVTVGDRKAAKKYSKR